MFILQFSSKLYELCKNDPPKLLDVEVDLYKDAECCETNVKLEIDGMTLTVNAPDSNTVSDIVELKKHIGEKLMLIPVDNLHCSVSGFIVPVVAEEAEDTSGGLYEENIEPPPVEAIPQQVVPEEKPHLPESTTLPECDKVKRAGTPNQTRGCTFRNKSF